MRRGHVFFFFSATGKIHLLIFANLLTCSWHGHQMVTKKNSVSSLKAFQPRVAFCFESQTQPAAAWPAPCGCISSASSPWCSARWIPGTHRLHRHSLGLLPLILLLPGKVELLFQLRVNTWISPTVMRLCEKRNLKWIHRALTHRKAIHLPATARPHKGGRGGGVLPPSLRMCTCWRTIDVFTQCAWKLMRFISNINSFKILLFIFNSLILIRAPRYFPSSCYWRVFIFLRNFSCTDLF